MSLRSGKLPFLGSEDEFFTIRDYVEITIKALKRSLKPAGS
jgi:hypothetical protein